MTSGSELSLSSGSSSACSWVRDFHQKTEFISDLSPLPFGCQTRPVRLQIPGCGRFPHPLPSASSGPGSPAPPPPPRPLGDGAFLPGAHQPPGPTPTSGLSPSSPLAVVSHFPESQLPPGLQGEGEREGYRLDEHSRTQPLSQPAWR